MGIRKPGRRRVIQAVLLGGAALAAGIGPALASQPSQLALSRYRLSAGGGTLAKGPLSLAGTFAQAEGGTMLGGGYVLNGGFMFESPRGDCNCDGVTSLVDFAQLDSCLCGPGNASAGACSCFDVNSDGDVDLMDFVAFQTSFGSAR